MLCGKPFLFDRKGTSLRIKNMIMRTCAREKQHFSRKNCRKAVFTCDAKIRFDTRFFTIQEKYLIGQSGVFKELIETLFGQLGFFLPDDKILHRAACIRSAGVCCSLFFFRYPDFLFGSKRAHCFSAQGLFQDAPCGVESIVPSALPLPTNCPKVRQS